MGKLWRWLTHKNSMSIQVFLVLPWYGFHMGVTILILKVHMTRNVFWTVLGYSLFEVFIFRFWDSFIENWRFYELAKIGFCVKVPCDLDCDVVLVANSQTQHKVWQSQQVNRREEGEGIALKGLPTTKAVKMQHSPLVYQCTRSQHTQIWGKNG